MIKKIFYLILPIIALVLEVLPWGAVLKFAGEQNADGTFEYIYQTESYFSMLPFGYANFAPFITGICTCIGIGILIGYCVSGKKGYVIAGRWLFLATGFINLFPLLYGREYLSYVAIIISFLFSIEVGLLMKEIEKLEVK